MSPMQFTSSRDGVKLFRRSWLVDQPLGTVVLVHGIAEHTGRYQHVAAQLNRWGWSVESYDQRGHGQSEGQRGGLTQQDDLVRDLGVVVHDIRRHVSGPLVLLGHSMGGLVVGRYAAFLTALSTSPNLSAVDGVVMVSPALDVPTTLFQRCLMATVGRLFPDITVSTGFDPVAICNDPAVVAAYSADPLVHDRISSRLGRFFVDAGPATLACAPRWTIPTLVLYAGADAIVNPRGSAQFVEQAPRALVRGQVFPTLAHEILNAPEQADVFAALKPWLAEQHHAWQQAQPGHLAAA